MSKATYEQKLKDAGTRLLPKLHDFIQARSTTDSFLIRAEQLARWAGLTRRNGRIDDNQLYHLLQLAQVPSNKVRQYGQRCWDAREVFENMAKWSGAYQWLV